MTLRRKMFTLWPAALLASGCVPADNSDSAELSDLVLLSLIFVCVFVSMAQRTRASKSVTDTTGGGGTSGAVSAPPLMVRSSEEDVETPRTTRSRPRTVELQDLLESVAGQMRTAGFEVSIVCPAIQISVDPLCLQRVVFGAIGAAILRGAEHAGVVVEATDDEVVMISIGDDGAPPKDHLAVDVQQHMEEGTREAFAGAHVTTNWTREAGVTMFSITAYQGALERIAPVGAVGASQPA